MSETSDITLEESVRAAVAAMTWVKDSDQAVIELACKYAAQIDRAEAEVELGIITHSDYAKVLYLGVHVLKCLESLGGTPVHRKAILEGTGGPKSKIAELKAERKKNAPEKGKKS